MERRWTTRTEMNVNLDVATPDSVIADCEILDIGLGGVYIATKGTALSEGTEVELNFQLNTEENTEQTIRAKVVRSYSDGAGLMFRDFDAVAFRVLQKIIKTYGRTAPEPIMG